MSILHANLTILDAIEHPKLFLPWFGDRESWAAWRAFLCALFALPMSETELEIYRKCTGRIDPPAAQAREAWMIVGRRGGKSLTLAALAVFVGCFGDFRRYIVPGERLLIPVLAADRRQAESTVGYVRAMLTTIPMLKKILIREVADSFELNNGLTIEITTASFRTARGFTAPLILCDEIAFFMSSETSANPDKEILRGLKPALGTIPNSILLCASSPYAKKGSLYETHKKHFGRAGNVLVWQAATKIMNPSLPQSVIDDAFADDPESASAEYGAQFRSDISTFIDRAVVEACVDAGVFERPFRAGLKYRAFVDPSGGSSDSMTLAIAHTEGEVHIIDVAKEIPAPFDPESAVAEFVRVLKTYRIRQVTGDRYAAEWTRQSFERHGVRYQLSEMNRSELYLETLPALNAKRVRLLDNARLIGQLAGLERRTTRGGKDSVDHSPGAKDDLANAVAGVIAVGAAPANTVTCESLDSFFAKMNSDNYAMAGGERKYVGPAPNVVPHPTRGLPEWMQ